MFNNSAVGGIPLFGTAKIGENPFQPNRNQCIK
jgi:hypothetical protein